MGALIFSTSLHGLLFFGEIRIAPEYALSEGFIWRTLSCSQLLSTYHRELGVGLFCARQYFVNMNVAVRSMVPTKKCRMALVALTYTASNAPCIV